MARTTPMNAASIRQRAGSSLEFLQVAQERVEFCALSTEPCAAAQVSAANAIHAGIAAADAICGKVLGARANDQDHKAAAELLETVLPNGADLAKRLRRLLKDKSLLQYGGYCTPNVAQQMTKEASHLVAALGSFAIRV